MRQLSYPAVGQAARGPSRFQLLTAFLTGAFAVLRHTKTMIATAPRLRTASINNSQCPDRPLVCLLKSRASWTPLSRLHLFELWSSCHLMCGDASQKHRRAEPVISIPGCSPLGDFLSEKRHLPFGDLLFGFVTLENFPEMFHLLWRLALYSLELPLVSNSNIHNKDVLAYPR